MTSIRSLGITILLRGVFGKAVGLEHFRADLSATALVIDPRSLQ